jgi:hypothetical protein
MLASVEPIGNLQPATGRTHVVASL